MGRRARWAYYSLKRLALLALLVWAGMGVARYMANYYDDAVKANAEAYVLPRVVTVSGASVEQFLKEPNQVTLIFVFSSRSILSRWYFDNFNQMAADYASYGVRFLFLSVDEDIRDMANFLASQGVVNFVPLYLQPSDREGIINIIARLGGDPFGGALPYMGVMNQQLFLRDFSVAITRTGKIEEVLKASLRGQ